MPVGNLLTDCVGLCWCRLRDYAVVNSCVSMRLLNMSGHEAGLVGDDDGLDPVAHVELGENIAHVGLDGGG